MSEVDEFFQGLPTQDKNLVDDILGGEPAKAPEKEAEDEEGSTLKNRRERRMAEKLQAERESAIALNQRVIDLAEEVKTLRGQKQTAEVATLDPDLVRVFGSTPEGQEMTKIFQSKLQGLKASAVEDAKSQLLEEMSEREQQSQAEYQEELGQNEGYIDSQLESLEEEHGIDLTSNSPSAVKARKEFLGLVEKLSPKDSEGAIREYADFESTFEIYQGSRTKAEPSRAKEFASRSMQNSTGSGGQEAPQGPMTFSKARQFINRTFSN